MKLEEIQTRFSEINDLLEKAKEDESIDVDALEKEINELTEQRNAIKQAKEERDAKLKGIMDGTIESKVIYDFKQEGEERKMENEKTLYRSAFLKSIRGLELTDAEKRAFETTSGAQAVIPTELADEIIEKAKKQSPLLEHITMLNVNGNVKFAVEGANASAALHKENAAITSSKDEMVEVVLSQYEITKLITISASVRSMTIESFERWLVENLAEKIANKAAEFVIGGTGSSQPTGVNSLIYDDTNSVTVAAAKTLASADVQTLIGLLPAYYDSKAIFTMSKRTLFTDFMPLQDNSKNAIVRVEGNNYYVYGYPVVLCDDVTYHEAFLGDFTKVVANMSQNVEVKTAFDIDHNSYKYLGVAAFDCKPATADAFVKLVKASA